MDIYNVFVCLYLSFYVYWSPLFYLTLPVSVSAYASTFFLHPCFLLYILFPSTCAISLFPPIYYVYLCFRLHVSVAAYMSLSPSIIFFPHLFAYVSLSMPFPLHVSVCVLTPPCQSIGLCLRRCDSIPLFTSTSIFLYIFPHLFLCLSVLSLLFVPGPIC